MKTTVIGLMPKVQPHHFSAEIDDWYIEWFRTRISPYLREWLCVFLSLVYSICCWFEASYASHVIPDDWEKWVRILVCKLYVSLKIHVVSLIMYYDNMLVVHHWTWTFINIEAIRRRQFNNLIQLFNKLVKY